MDKYELTIKIEQLDKLVKSRDYVSAAKVAEQIEWKKMKQWSVMSNAIDAFIATEKYDKARNVCIYAYNRKLGGRRLLATLMDMYVRLGEYEDAEEIYHEYVELAPRDVARYILLYKLKRAEGAPVTELIEILQDYKEKELDEEYEYELALLYSEAGMTDRCVRECDELVLWFADGVYVEKALRLKQMYTPLSQRQLEKLARLEKMSSMGINSSELVTDSDSYDDEAAATAEEQEERHEFSRPEMKVEEQEFIKPEQTVKPKKAAVKPEQEAYVPRNESAAGRTEGVKKSVPAEKPEPVDNIAEKQVQYVDDLGNTTEWSPIDVEAVEETENYGEPQQEPEPAEVEEPEPKPVMSQEMQTIENDYDIDIKVPDYSVYDTRNVQQELKANVEEIMEAYKNREKTEALREAAELQDMRDDSDPTKEIIINKHQWRKASRNTAAAKPKVSPDMTIRQAAEQMTIEQMAEVVAQLQAEQERRKREAAQKDDQIDGQMDISQWLSDIDDEPDEVEPQKIEPERVEPEKVEPQKIEPEKVEPEKVEPQKTEPERVEPEKVEPQKIEPERVEPEKAEQEEQVSELHDSYEVQPTKRIPVREIAAALDKQQEEEAEPEEYEEFEEIPEVDDEADSMENTLDLEEAVNAGIERIIDDTVKGALGESDAGRYTLREEEKKFLDKYLYMSGMERRLCRYIGSFRAGNIGNIMIMGSRNTDKITFAVNLFKALHAYDEEREQKLARISADKLNEKSYEAYADKLAGQTLIIENAGRLKRGQIVSMMKLGNANATTFIIVDEEYEINKLFAENPDFAETFTGCFLLKQYTVNELVDIAKDYADENGWRIEDKALLKLYLILSQLPNDDQGNIVGIVKETMERAAEHAGNSIGNKLFGRFRSALIIKESDFKEAVAEEDDDYEKDTYDDDDDYDEDDE